MFRSDCSIIFLLGVGNLAIFPRLLQASAGFQELTLRQAAAPLAPQAKRPARPMMLVPFNAAEARNANMCRYRGFNLLS